VPIERTQLLVFLPRYEIYQQKLTENKISINYYSLFKHYYIDKCSLSSSALLQNTPFSERRNFLQILLEYIENESSDLFSSSGINCCNKMKEKRDLSTCYLESRREQENIDFSILDPIDGLEILFIDKIMYIDYANELLSLKDNENERRSTIDRYNDKPLAIFIDHKVINSI
jgi:hypothetical protein